MGLLYRKTKQTLNYLEEKPEVYRLQQITYPAVTFDQLVNECSTSCGVNASQTKAVINALTDRLVHYMEIGHGVKVGEFGSFKPVFTSKVSATIENLSTENVRQKKVRFTPGKKFKSMLDDMTISGASEVLDNAE